ncbi:MAG: translation initiation factor IF-2 [Planctomycetota bacterium]
MKDKDKEKTKKKSTEKKVVTVKKAKKPATAKIGPVIEPKTHPALTTEVHAKTSNPFHKPDEQPKPELKHEPEDKKIQAPIIIEETKTEEKDIRALRSTEIAYYDKEVVTEDAKGKISAKQAELRAKTAPKKTFFLKRQHYGRSVTPQPVKAPVKTETERKITLELPIRVKEISEKIGVKVSQIIQKLMQHNIMLTINDTLSEDAIILIGLEFNYEIDIAAPKDIASKYSTVTVDKKEDLVLRPPVVVVMGHVDHGKTSLLDKIRNTNVAATEQGLITQHIGASEVEFNGRKIVFLDTPGHEAFTSMRARGANITDIAILVVAADDGVMPQTEEAIKHARVSNVLMIIAVNKIDKKEANLHKVKQQLASMEIVPEEWGGKTIFCEVSALTGQGVDHLLEMILLQSEMLELKANPKRKAYGVVLESRMTENYGVVANCLVQNGTLRAGNIISCGCAYGKVRTMLNSKNKTIAEAPPSTPVQIIGLSELPEAGDKFYTVDGIHTAKELSEAYTAKKKTSIVAPVHSTLENLFIRLEENKIKEVRLLIKADVNGSLEVLPNMLAGISTGEVKVNIIHKGIGQINESDVLLADATDAIIIGFNVSAEEKSASLAKQIGVEIKIYGVIYQILEELRLAMEGLLEPEKVEVTSGWLTVKNIFKISALGNIAGCQVTNGKIERNCMVRVHRGKDIIHTGKIASLKRVKDDVKEVANGFECGLRLEGSDNINVGDTIEAFHIEKRMKKLSPK